MISGKEMIKQGILWRRTSRVRDEKNASKRHKEDIRQEILSIIDEKWKDENPSLKARMSQYGNSPPMVIFEGRTPILILVINMATVYTNRAIKAYESWCNYKPLVQSNLVTRMESMTTPTYNVYVGWKKGNARVSVVILIKSPDDRKFIRKILDQSSRIKSKLLIARFILASSCRMSLSSVVFWTIRINYLGKFSKEKKSR
ncbi:hypothetical protein Gotri_020511 [Gossypium trilobum]|uniref:Uncharacterized protein n=1 Tax=Gossypium trilobum TaxID=34281 RepID=A0A7J9D9J5_9ROSI|nr:hypothetical protein [Gossypium trilobum]